MPTKVFDIKPTYAVEYAHFSAEERSQHEYTKPPPRIGTRQMSANSRKKLMNAIQWLKLFSPLHKVYCKERKQMVQFRLNFITLTLSSQQIHSDAFIKKHMLEPFLKWIARNGANSYVWKAEAQNNGNIHFHITTNHYLHWKSIRMKWNQLQENHGYLTAFFKEHGHHDPNSTDVHAVKNDLDVGRYMGKYFGKLEYWCKDKKTKIPKEHIEHPSRFITRACNDDSPFPVPKRQIDGRKWAVSNNLAHIKCFMTERDPEYFPTTTAYLHAQEYDHMSCDFAEIWYYPHIADSGAPPVIADKLYTIQQKVKAHDD